MALSDRLTLLAQRIAADVKLLKKPAYRFGFFCKGLPDAGEFFGPFYPDVDFILPATLAGSICKSKAAFTSASSWALQREGATILTISFAANANAGTFSMSGGADLTVTRGQALEWVAPATQDATGAGIGLTVVGRVA